VKYDGNVEVRHDYITLDYLKNDCINEYMGHVFLNAPGAPFDVFEFFDIEKHKHKTLFLGEQVKLSDTEAVMPMIIVIDQKLFDEEHCKVILVKMIDNNFRLVVQVIA